MIRKQIRKIRGEIRKEIFDPKNYYFNYIIFSYIIF